MKKKLLSAAAAALLLSGCHHLNGLIDAGDEFGCGVAPGARCATLSENFNRQEAAFDRAERLAVADDEEFAAADGAVRTETPAKSKAREAKPARTEAKKAGEALGKRTAKALPREIDERYPRAARTFFEPRRAAEVVMQLWVMPWVDSDGDFHAASRLWLKVKDARWQIERERSRATARAVDPGDAP